MQENAKNEELAKITNNLECVGLVADIAEKNNINVMQVFSYMKTYTALKSIKETIQ